MILLPDKLLIFSHNNLFAQDVIFVLIQLNSKQIILSYWSNHQPQTNHKPPDFFGFYFWYWILNMYMCLNQPSYPMYESLFQTHQPRVRQPISQQHSTHFFNQLSLCVGKQNTTNNKQHTTKKNTDTMIPPAAGFQRLQNNRWVWSPNVTRWRTISATQRCNFVNWK